MKTLTIEALTRAAFAPFGDVIETEGARQIPINLGTTIRFHDLARVDVAEQGGHTLVNLFRGQPRALPFEVKMLERHPLGSQAFLPLSERPYLVVVAPAGELDPAQIRAFVSNGWQGVNYAKGVWHHPLIALGEVSDFVVVDRGGEGSNLNEQMLEESLWLTEEALHHVAA
ncbi:ureidoglycolate hydrolase [Burkholderia gladioli]|jgi:ureidoglycolate lyase|uniref:Ureidoglycolate lyase n=1 Tax=Burkholderia gladioli TaxID=28095 RepID=A0AAW7R3T7_BURGA|nr:ureidoglycolate lyase [Burkholderia gladioli]AJW97611.1 ureidoglycolate hydrolase family protein [Burkholderia gladioli]ASD79654.1 ureidoglycolate lyase [Burkholderia gladioli pv. gladioli]AWY55107.1 ureidoglycolate lyase [Burkholderia gladioli pv. gladioli]KAF1062227.1 Ureidoglycolate lyase [Burkholderia gladioli]KGC11108.1 ureidoglycolate hydrolase family protein [Burkholderia gladioli]